MENADLILTLKSQIIEYLNLMDMTPEEFDEEAPLFGEGSEIGLDSIDAIELSVLLEREYGLKITDPKEGRKVMSDVKSMAAYIVANVED